MRVKAQRVKSSVGFVWVLPKVEGSHTVGQILAARLRLGETGQERITAGQVAQLRHDYVAALLHAVDSYDRLTTG